MYIFYFVKLAFMPKNLIQGNSYKAIKLSTGIILSALLLSFSTKILAHGGHGDEFQGGNTGNAAAESISVDAETAKRLLLKVEPVKSQKLSIAIKTTGQIETLPSNRVEVTAPTPGKVIKLLVEPGSAVKAGQTVAVISTPELVELRVSSQEKRAEAQASYQKAQTNLKLAQQNYENQQKIAAAELTQVKAELQVAQEQYNRDLELTDKGVIPKRQLRESQAKLALAQADLTKVLSYSEVLQAESELKRAKSEVEAANSLLNLSNTAYETRLEQLGIKDNELGWVAVTAPISGRVADREVTLGQSFQDAGGLLMTIVDDQKVLATANIYEKDLNKIKTGQQVIARVASLSDRTFKGRITIISSVVEGETRVVPVKAQLDNFQGVLFPGMFAELEVLTNNTNSAVLAIPTSAIVEANGKNLVYLQNGDQFQAIEVTLGETSGDMVEVKSGLFEGDLIVTQRAPQLYAQSLRGESKPTEGEKNQEKTEPTTPEPVSTANVWPWLLIGGCLVGAGFVTGVLTGRRSHSQQVYQENLLDKTTEIIDESTLTGLSRSPRTEEQKDPKPPR